jgi:hypothetical protein
MEPGRNRSEPGRFMHRAQPFPGVRRYPATTDRKEKIQTEPDVMRAEPDRIRPRRARKPQAGVRRRKVAVKAVAAGTARIGDGEIGMDGRVTGHGGRLRGQPAVVRDRRPRIAVRAPDRRSRCKGVTVWTPPGRQSLKRCVQDGMARNGRAIRTADFRTPSGCPKSVRKRWRISARMLSAWRRTSSLKSSRFKPSALGCDVAAGAVSLRIIRIAGCKDVCRPGGPVSPFPHGKEGTHAAGH